MRIHVVAVAGTGMGSLAGLLTELGHEVSGSDVEFDPPMGPALREWGVRCLEGFDSSHLRPAPDLVVVGNVCRRDNVEARAAIDGGLTYTHIAGALQRFVLEGCSPLVVSGTHGKTTTTALSAWLLEGAGLAPGFLVGGIPKNFGRSFRAPPAKRSLMRPGRRRRPFVIEGDEYDTAFFEKTAKFLHYRPDVAILTSIEHDHIDIYATFEEYVEAFRQFVGLIPPDGLVVANAADPTVVDVVHGHAQAEVTWYALEGESTTEAPHWMAAPAGSDATGTRFDLFAGGVACGRFLSPMHGNHNLRNALGAIAATCQGYGATVDAATAALARFEGVKRRLDLFAQPGGIFMYDDFAHHPTAVRETLFALRTKHGGARLFAVFEPRSATACRNLHQEDYRDAFREADDVLIAPLGRDLPPDERLDTERLVDDVVRQGQRARRFDSVDAIIDWLVSSAKSGDVVALLSNGSFGGIHPRLESALASAGRAQPSGDST